MSKMLLIFATTFVSPATNWRAAMPNNCKQSETKCKAQGRHRDIQYSKRVGTPALGAFLAENATFRAFVPMPPKGQMLFDHQVHACPLQGGIPRSILKQLHAGRVTIRTILRVCSLRGRVTLKCPELMCDSTLKAQDM